MNIPEIFIVVDYWMEKIIGVYSTKRLATQIKAEYLKMIDEEACPDCVQIEEFDVR